MKRLRILMGISLMICVYHKACAGTWHVDGLISASGDGRGWETAFKTIQEGIDAASDGDTVIVAAQSKGDYSENIHFKGKNIVVQSTDPTDPDIVKKTIIEGGLSGSVVTFAGSELETCVLSGFKILRGRAEDGGGICGGTFDKRTHATIENNVITSNSGTYYGGGIAHCDGIIRNNTISGNSAVDWGGGVIWCDGTIRNNVISRNSAEDAGGLCACHGIIQGNLIMENEATGTFPDGMGGGLRLCGGIIQDNMIVGNSAGLSGGGLVECHGTIRNNTVVGNSAPNYSGGGLAYCAAALNCIVWGNTAASSGPQLYGVSPPTYSCIQGGHGGEGNIGDDPLFVDPDGPDDNPATFEDNDYRLQGTSPCIDTGKNEGWMWDAVDLAATPRIIGATVDMGAYEYSTPEDTSPPYAWDRHPAPDDMRVPIDSNIVLHVKDYGNGVDEISVVMTVNGLEVTPTMIGTRADYTVGYDLLSDLAYSETVTVTIDAADLSSPANVMERVTYSFTTMAKPRPEATWYVDSSVPASGDGTSPETAFIKVQEGIDTACDGDTVIVAEGTYVENIMFFGKNLTLQSKDPLDQDVVRTTIIDGNEAGPVVTFVGTENETCILSGFTIRNGKAKNGGGICGGAWDNRTEATIQNNVITGNSAADYGGGGLAYCDGAIRDNTISDNRTMGGFAMGGGLAYCNGYIENNAIIENRSGGDAGGLAHCHGTIRCNTISGNTAGHSAGGLSDCGPIIQNNVIAGNRATYGGGLVTCDGFIQNNTVVGNSAQWRGAVLACAGIIRNCIIWENDTVIGTGSDARRISNSWMHNDPHFVDPDGPDNDPETYEDNDYRLAADSPCIDSGKNEDWMADAVDLDGNPRIWGNTVDIGAYEYGSFMFRCFELVSLLPGGTEITWSSRPPDNYIIWSCSDLLSGEWVEEATIPSAGQATGWTDPDTTSTHKFYRVELK